MRTQLAPPQPGELCAQARLGGWLAPDPQYGLGLRDESGRIHGVVWPYGYSMGRDSVGVFLVDRGGEVVARVGDRIAMAGNMSEADQVNHPCYDPSIEVFS